MGVTGAEMAGTVRAYHKRYCRGRRFIITGMGMAVIQHSPNRWSSPLSVLELKDPACQMALMKKR